MHIYHRHGTHTVNHTLHTQLYFPIHTSTPRHTQLYFLLYLCLVTRAYLYLRKRPFASHRMANMLEMLTWRQQFITFVVVLLSQIFLGWVGHGSCATRMIAWASGLFPTNVRVCVMLVCVCVWDDGVGVRM